MAAQMHGIDRISGVLGYLILNEDGAVVNSSGELKNMEALSEPVIALLRAVQKGKGVICKNDDDFQTVQVYARGVVHLIFRQNQKVCIVKKRAETEQSVL